VRRDIQIALFEDGELSFAQRQYLESFSTPLYLVVRAPEVSRAVWNGFTLRREWLEVMGNEEMRIYRFVGEIPLD
jgi:hypothetical protein